MRANTINAVASAIGLVALVGMVSLATALYTDGQDFWTCAFLGNLIAVATAFAAWSGALWKDAKNELPFPPTWQDWIGIFFVASTLAGIFVAIDVAVVHPGISLVFTIGALALSFVALPSALRAWISAQLSRKHRRRD